MAVYADNKVKPGFERELGVLVAEDLKAKSIITGSILLLWSWLSIQSANKPIEGTKHCHQDVVGGKIGKGSRLERKKNERRKRQLDVVVATL